MTDPSGDLELTALLDWFNTTLEDLGYLCDGRITQEERLELLRLKRKLVVQDGGLEKEAV